MAPTATIALLSSANLANGSAVVTSMPSSTPSMQFAVSEHSQTSPKQFIPFGVLAVFLILMFFSHVLRYPRLLYVSREPLGHHPRPTQDNPYASQPDRSHRSCREKDRDTPAGSLSTTSFSGSKRLSSFDPHTEAIYSEPTVRLVRAYHTRSPEPRVHLPEEITLPSPSSQTLVNSSRSDISLSSMDIQNLPARVYLPPALPETFELSLPQRRADVFCIDNEFLPLSNLVWIPPSNQNPPGLSTSPLARSLGGFINLTTSSDVLAVSTFQDQPQTSTRSSNLFTGSFEPGSRLAYSPELSPPPLAHAHPILVRRALSPWRRRSPLEPSYDTFMHMDPDLTCVSPHCHRPSVPSRLRYFITHSITTSFSGSQTPPTPASSADKRSEKSLMGSRPSSNRDGTVRPRLAEEEVGDRFSEDLLSASARMSELAITSGIPCYNSSSDNKSRAQANLSPQRRLLDKFKRLSVPEDVWRNLKASNTKTENVVKVAQDCHRRESLPCLDIHGKTPEYSSPVGLGLSLVSEPRYVEFDAHRVPPLPVASHVEGGEDIGVDAQYLQASGSLRTVPSRWMNSSPISCDAHAVIEERGLGSIPQDALADESVEIMIMGRSEGLDGVVG